MNVQPDGIFDFEVFPLQENLAFEGLGNNQKGLFVAIAGEAVPNDKELLSKMLQAAGFDMAEDAKIFWIGAQQPFSFSSLRNELGFSNALFFGIPPTQAGLMLNVKPYEPLSLNGINYLFAASLAEIQANPALKRPLWEGMKAMFRV
jgi:DNA polymerase III psi subunit